MEGETAEPDFFLRISPVAVNSVPIHHDSLFIANGDLNALPDDILRYILITLVFEYKEYPLVLTHINSRIRAIALDTPRLWSTLPNWDDSKYESSTESIFHHFLYHSQLAPLHIRLSAQTRATTTLIKIFRDPAYIFLGLFERISGLELDYYIPWSEEWLDRIRYRPPPSFCSLYNNVWGKDSEVLFPKLASLTIRMEPHDQEVLYGGVDISIVAHPFLKILTLSEITFSTNNWTRLLTLGLPKLEVLTLKGCVASYAEPTLIDLPSLKHLTLECPELLLVFSVPNLRTLRYSGQSFMKQIATATSSSGAFVNLHSLSYSTLVSNEPYSRGTNDSFSDFYDSDPHEVLRWLEIITSKGAPLQDMSLQLHGNAADLILEIIQWLRKPGAEGCPTLRRLDFKAKWPQHLLEVWESTDLDYAKEMLIPVIESQRDSFAVTLRITWNGHKIQREERWIQN